MQPCPLRRAQAFLRRTHRENDLTAQCHNQCLKNPSLFSFADVLPPREHQRLGAINIRGTLRSYPDSTKLSIYEQHSLKHIDCLRMGSLHATSSHLINHSAMRLTRTHTHFTRWRRSLRTRGPPYICCMLRLPRIRAAAAELWPPSMLCWHGMMSLSNLSDILAIRHARVKVPEIPDTHNSTAQRRIIPTMGPTSGHNSRHGNSCTHYFQTRSSLRSSLTSAPLSTQPASYLVEAKEQTVSCIISGHRDTSDARLNNATYISLPGLSLLLLFVLPLTITKTSSISPAFMMLDLRWTQFLRRTDNLQTMRTPVVGA